MRLAKDKSWMPVQAEQYFTSEEPGFIWKANINAALRYIVVQRWKMMSVLKPIRYRPSKLLSIIILDI
jgi:hypothetical protein